MARTELPEVILFMLAASACGFPRPPDIVGDAPVDMQPSGRACFGDDPFKLCLVTAPVSPLTLAALINTDTSKLCVTTTSSAAGYCVVAGTSILVTSEGPALRATGSRPLVLIASDSITVQAGIDVSSHHTSNPATDLEVGAGADFRDCPAPVVLPTNGGGGAGGGFAGAGGSGAAAARAGSRGGAAHLPLATVTTLRGGCPGQNGDGSTGDLGKGGHGGGAVLLIAANAIHVMADINASGEGGHTGAQNAYGGGGGGAGGMIVLDAPVVTSSGLLLANGGGGGEGSGDDAYGSDGLDPTTIRPAAGGTGLSDGGDGGNGSAGVAAGAGATGQNGTIVTQMGIQHVGGGGGGGGGAGIIMVPSGVVLGGMISPEVTLL
jgi:hypothetical protein